MAQMPVSTLRIWEQRYQAVGPGTAPSGHRLYSAADVQRVQTLRQLTQQGHAIGALAALDAAQLAQVAEVAEVAQVARTQASRAAAQRVAPGRQTTAVRVAVVGHALALRLQRPAVAASLSMRWRVVAVFDSLAEAAQASPAGTVDLLLWLASGLQSAALAELNAAQQAVRARHAAVVYRFASAAARRTLADTGALLVREPSDDAALAAWLASLEGAITPSTERQNHRRGLAVPPGEVSPRRFDDATLTALAAMSTPIACECPRHVAELLMQLGDFVPTAQTVRIAARPMPNCTLTWRVWRARRAPCSKWPWNEWPAKRV